jgi:hypothetical protein
MPDKNNLWEIFNFDDLVHCLRNAQKRFVVLAIVTEETDKKNRIIIRNLLKKKSKIYPKVTFLFYTAQKENFGKLKPMFDKDKTEYPKLFHIWDVKDIMTDLVSIDNEDIMEESFQDYHDFYLEGSLPGDDQDDTQSVSNESEEPLKKPKSSSKKNKKEAEQLQINNKNQQSMKPQGKQQMPRQVLQQSPPPPQPYNKEYKDPDIEKKKLSEKIKLLRAKQDEYIEIFVDEYKKRKKEEEGRVRGKSSNKDKNEKKKKNKIK